MLIHFAFYFITLSFLLCLSLYVFFFLFKTLLEMVNGHFKHFPIQDSLRRRESSRAEPEPRKSFIHVIMVLITLSKTFLIQSVNYIYRMSNKMPSFVLSPTQLWFFLITLTRDLMKLRWRRQGGRQKNNRFNEQNNNSTRTSHFFVHFFAVPAQQWHEMTTF